MLIFGSFCSSKNPENNYSTVLNIDHNQKCFSSSKSAYYYDFWRSCDTEDWCWKYSFDHRNKLHFNTYSHIKQLYKYFTILLLLLYLDQINAGLLSRRDLFRNIKNITVQKLLTGSVFFMLLEGNDWKILWPIACSCCTESTNRGVRRRDLQRTVKVMQKHTRNVMRTVERKSKPKPKYFKQIRNPGQKKRTYGHPI